MTDESIAAEPSNAQLTAWVEEAQHTYRDVLRQHSLVLDLYRHWLSERASPEVLRASSGSPPRDDKPDASLG